MHGPPASRAFTHHVILCLGVARSAAPVSDNCQMRVHLVDTALCSTSFCYCRFMGCRRFCVGVRIVRRTLGVSHQHWPGACIPERTHCARAFVPACACSAASAIPSISSRHVTLLLRPAIRSSWLPQHTLYQLWAGAVCINAIWQGMAVAVTGPQKPVR